MLNITIFDVTLTSSIYQTYITSYNAPLDNSQYNFNSLFLLFRSYALYYDYLCANGIYMAKPL